ncbi:MAG: carboxypeptidase-like regulatory domain-containing protein, partial [Pararhodobacter sp.]|nr:carboxypeptidase-like regulatory domain-containing protein [Pararhodobacter sp.]
MPLFAAVLLAAPAAAADEEWTAPEPLTVPTIEYPVGATGVGRVAVRLTVRAAGDVTGIVILDANDLRFADPVSAALGDAVFLPARFRGEPRAVSVEFELEVAPPPTVVLPAVLRGQVLEQGTRRPLSGAEVIAVGADRGVATDGDGRFELDVAPGPVTIVVATPGFVPSRFAEAVSAGEMVEVVYRLRPEARSP